MADVPITEAYWIGYYNACELLLSSPRMNKPQCEIIEETARKAHDELTKLGARRVVAHAGWPTCAPARTAVRRSAATPRSTPTVSRV